MSHHPSRYATCPECGKKSYPSWAEARRSARDMVRLSGKARGVTVYFSRPCRAIHVGHSTAGAYKKAQGR